MRKFSGILLLGVTIGLVWLLDNPLGSLPAIGRLLDPINGCWANAEPADCNFNADLKLKEVKDNVTVWLDEQMVPHIHANNDHDLFFAQGYVHASFRLWQMDMQTRAAAGRISEIVGGKALDYDRRQRRKGMVYAGEQSLKAMETDPRTRQMMDAYTKGVNTYIKTLGYRDYPLEYKLMGFKPEPWTNLKSALLLKYMADDLTGSPDDIPLSYLREILPPDQFNLLYPLSEPGSTPVIPPATKYDPASLPTHASPLDTVFPHFTRQQFTETKEDGKGSNNWVVSGTRTASGAPILCNDPHLGLNLPSLWYQVQLQAPGINAYGVSLPGAPGVIIGFNESISWGFTNNYRDVKDYYLLRPADNGSKYWFAGKKRTYTTRIETIKIKGARNYEDTVRYTLHGPVMYDEHYPAPGGLKKPLAMCWMAHRPTNELLAIYLMDKATDYASFVDGIINFQCPGQNMIYADKAGNIALWGQGQFINKWKGQGRFIMDGSDSNTLWQELIPPRENPHVYNPAQGYLASANQCVTDSTYPYWYNGDFTELRGWRINQVLSAKDKVNIEDMFALQNDNYSLLAAGALPVMLKHLTANLNEQQQEYKNKLASWNYQLEANSEEAGIFQLWWHYFYNDTWKGLGRGQILLYPKSERTMQLLQQVDKETITVPQMAQLNDLLHRSFKMAADSLSRTKNGRQWGKIKNTSIMHLTKLPAFSSEGINTGGWGNTVNAMKGNHGPSWRMVVQMGQQIEAWGVYPGGQSGNPGSKYYTNFISKWADGKYYPLLFLPNSPAQQNKSLKYTLTIHQ